MELTVYNPQKGRLETMAVDFTDNNTTWFNNCEEPGDIRMITDFNGDLVISEFSWDYPVRVYNASRALVHYDQKQAKELQCQALRL